MTVTPLGIYGIGSYLPPSISVAELIRQDGGDPSVWDSWNNVRVASDQDHPSTMGAEALRRALTDAAISPGELKLVLSTCSSRDYPPSWPVSIEVMRLLEIPNPCLGFDIMLGCMGILCALETAESWLQARGGGYAAIVGAERWAMTIDRKDPRAISMWGASDGATALIVGTGGAATGEPLTTYRGAAFHSSCEFNNSVIIRNGGTRFPAPSEGDKPLSYYLQPGADISSMSQAFVLAYGKVCSILKSRFGITPDWLVCNQVSVDNMKAVGQLARIKPDKVCVTGHDAGHVGPNDIVLGLESLRNRGLLAGNVVAVSNTPYSWGAALFQSGRPSG